MKTQLLTAVIATTLLVTGTQTSRAGDLSSLYSALQSTSRPTARPARPVRPVRPRPQASRPVAPQLLLGAYLKEARGGLQVTGTAPDSPASKALQDGDVIRRIAANGQPPRTLKTMNQFELAKQQIGVVRQAVLEIDRPGRGTEYVQVTFQPGQLARFSTGKQSSAVTMFNTSN